MIQWLFVSLLAMSGLAASEDFPRSCQKLNMGEFYGNATLYAETAKSSKWLEPFVVPDHKLIFCKVAKNGSSGWLRLFRRLAGFPDWQRNPYFFMGSKIGGLSQLKHYGATRAMEMMTDPSWKKVVILREPLERLLSGFLDKIHQAEDSKAQLGLYSKALHNVPVERFTKMEFREFVHRLHVALNAGEFDQHWSVQSEDCGLDFWGPVYDLALFMVHSGCDKEAMREEIFQLLRPVTLDPAGLEAAADSFTRVAGDVTRHETNHTGWYTKEIYEEAYKIYEIDYARFGVAKPALEDLLTRR
eukprot:scaffold576_cov260-Pinguiococcus_pyrenoidosus.AAC.100